MVLLGTQPVLWRKKGKSKPSSKTQEGASPSIMSKRNGIISDSKDGPPPRPPPYVPFPFAAQYLRVTDPLQAMPFSKTCRFVERWLDEQTLWCRLHHDRESMEIVVAYRPDYPDLKGVVEFGPPPVCLELKVEDAVVSYDDIYSLGVDRDSGEGGGVVIYDAPKVTPTALRLGAVKLDDPHTEPMLEKVDDLKDREMAEKMVYRSPWMPMGVMRDLARGS